MYVLENGACRLDFDEQTGAIVKLLNKSTGWDVIGQPKLAMGIQLLVPTATHRNNKAYSERQRLTRAKLIESKSMALYWDGILCEKSGLESIVSAQAIGAKVTALFCMQSF